MEFGTLVKSSFFVGLILSIIGAYLQIIHSSYADIFLMAGIMFTFLFIGSAVTEVFASKRIAKNEKLMWTIGFVFFSSIAGLVYVLIGRRRIVQGI